MNLYLIRHAQPEPTVGDPPLSTAGEEQAAKLAAMFVRLNNLHNIQAGDVRVVNSKLKRANQTAQIIHTALNVPTKRTVIHPPATDVSASVNLERLLTKLRSAASGSMTTIPPAPVPKEIILVWHHPYVGDALNWLVGNDLLEWPNVYGATAGVECSDITFGQGTGVLRWFILPEMLP